MVLSWVPEEVQGLFSPLVVGILSAFSVFLLIVSVAAGLALAKWLPSDYFVRHRQRSLPQEVCERGARFAILLGLRQLLGLLLLLAGGAMLVLPGQGLLTILAALCIAEYPGKRSLLLRLIRRGPLRKSLDALRRRAGQPPLELP